MRDPKITQRISSIDGVHPPEYADTFLLSLPCSVQKLQIIFSFHFDFIFSLGSSVLLNRKTRNETLVKLTTKAVLMSANKKIFGRTKQSGNPKTITFIRTRYLI